MPANDQAPLAWVTVESRRETAVATGPPSCCAETLPTALSRVAIACADSPTGWASCAFSSTSEVGCSDTVTPPGAVAVTMPFSRTPAAAAAAFAAAAAAAAWAPVTAAAELPPGLAVGLPVALALGFAASLAAAVAVAVLGWPGRIAPANFGMPISAAASQIDSTAASATSRVLSGLNIGRAVTEPVTLVGAPRPRAAIRNGCRLRPPTSCGRLTATRPRTRAMPPGGSTMRCRLSRSASPSAASVRSSTSAVPPPELRSSTSIRTPVPVETTADPTYSSAGPSGSGSLVIVTSRRKLRPGTSTPSRTASVPRRQASSSARKMSTRAPTSKGSTCWA